MLQLAERRGKFQGGDLSEVQQFALLLLMRDERIQARQEQFQQLRQHLILSGGATEDEDEYERVTEDEDFSNTEGKWIIEHPLDPEEAVALLGSIEQVRLTGADFTSVGDGEW